MSDILLDYIQNQLLGGRDDVKLSAEDDLLGSGLVDSLGMMKMITFIEDHFNLKIPHEDMVIENFMTVGDIGNYLQKKQIQLND